MLLLEGMVRAFPILFTIVANAKSEISNRTISVEINCSTCFLISYVISRVHAEYITTVKRGVCLI